MVSRWSFSDLVVLTHTPPVFIAVLTLTVIMFNQQHLAAAFPLNSVGLGFFAHSVSNLVSFELIKSVVCFWRKTR